MKAVMQDKMRLQINYGFYFGNYQPLADSMGQGLEGAVNGAKPDYYNQINDNSTSFVNNNNRILGAVRFVHYRVKNNQCPIINLSSAWKTTDSSFSRDCYA